MTSAVRDGVLRPSAAVWERLAERIAAETGEAPLAATDAPAAEPEWREVADGIFCQVLAEDTERDRISMLVRLAPGVEYPPHRHAGAEELYLLDGELFIGERKLYPGDGNYAEPGTRDTRVYTITGCTCLLITSGADELG